MNSLCNLFITFFFTIILNSSINLEFQEKNVYKQKNISTENTNKKDSLDLSFLRQCILLDEKGMKKSLANIIKNSGCKLVLVLSEGLCSPCFAEDLELFKDAKKYINEKDIMLIVPLENLRALNVYKKTNNIIYKSYIYSKNSLNINSPFYVFIDKSLNFNYIHKVKELNSKETIFYFKLINSKITKCL